MTWSRPWSWEDAAKAKAGRKLFAPSRAAERTYFKQLRGVADQVAGLLKGGDPQAVQARLRDYAAALDPWAQQAAANMVKAVARKNDASWRAAAERWGIDLRGMLEADVTAAVNARIQENIRLIKSLPGDAADRVGELAQKALLSGERVDQVAQEIAAQGDVTRNRARVIALTEVSKAGTALTQARAESVGSEGYIWRTARDGQTRPSHAAMEGRFVRWDSPPTLDNMTGHAGEFPNCRCYPEPVVHDSAGKPSASPLPTAEQEKAAGKHELRSQWEKQAGSTVVPHIPGEPLPNLARAVIPPAKLAGYALNPTNPKGRSKARVFSAALGLGPGDAAMLERQILAGLPDRAAMRHRDDGYGERFRVLIPVTGPNGRTVDVLTGWIYDRDDKAGSVSTIPRLTTMYVKG